MPSIFDIPSDVNIITVRKTMSKLNSEARKNAKPNTCILCGKPQTSFCNSHSVPQMSLRAIANEGTVLLATFSLGINKEIVDVEKGVNKSGTFNFICNNCDSLFFQDYENPDNLNNQPTDKMMAEIAVKNYLLQMCKRSIEIEQMQILQRDYNIFENHNDLKEIQELDFNEFETEVLFHKNIVENEVSGAYQILFWKVLPYTVPIAMQSAIALTKDIEGIEVNNIHNIDLNVRMQYMHLAILPFEDKSMVLAFYHKRDKAYKRLYQQMNSMKEEEILKYINYLVFKYTENYFIAKEIEKEIDTNVMLQKLSMEYDEMPSFGILGVQNSFGIGYVPVGISEIPNFLAPEWAVLNEN